MKTNRKRRILKGLLGVMGLLLAALAVLAALMDHNLANERSAARREGIALTPAELHLPAVPPQQDARPDYLALFHLLRNQKQPDPTMKVQILLADSDGPLAWTRRDVALIRRFLHDDRRAMALLHQAAQKPRISVVRTFRDDENPSGESLYAKQRDNAEMLRLESLLSAHDGHFSQAIQNQTLGFRIAEHAAADFTILGHLVGVGVETSALEGFKDILAMAGADARVAAEVRRAVVSHPVPYSLRRAYQGDLLYGLGYAAKLRRYGPPYWSWMLGEGMDEPYPPFHGAPMAQPMRAVYGIWVDGSEAYYLHGMRRVLLAAKEPPPTRILALNKASEPLGRPGGFFSLFSSVVTPVLSKAETRETQVVAERRIIAASAAVLSYKAAHGRFPTTLKQADAPTFIDPFTGKPLRYRHTPRGFTLFSAGEDGDFDPDKPLLSQRKRSLVFQYPVRTWSRAP